MIYMAALVVAGLVAYVIADTVRGQALRRTMLELSQAFRKELAALQTTAEGIEALRDKVEADMLLRDKEAEYGKDTSDFPNFTATVFERPYTRLSLESGTQRIVAALDSIGQFSFEERFDNPEVLFVQEFSRQLPHGAAMDLLTSIIQDYNQLTTRARHRPAKGLSR